MDSLMTNIHADLRSVRNKYEWLSGYDDKCFDSGSSIFFGPKSLQDEETSAQQPDQLWIGYGSINAPKTLKYVNDIEDEKVCYFPSLDSRVYVHMVIRGTENNQLAKEIRRIVIDRCRLLQHEIK